MPNYADTDFALRWPKELFLRVAQATRGANAIEILIEDAFVNGVELARDIEPDSLDHLIEHADELRERRTRRAYWSQRRGGEPPPRLSLPDVAALFVDLIDDLTYRGYFERTFGRDCVDRPRPGVEPALALKQRLGRDDLWPLRVTMSTWNRDTLFDLIEFFDDIAARPTDGSYHGFGGCRWEYSEYSSATGQVVYRWEINQILADSDLGYRIADAGEDAGHLVAVTEDARDDLVAQILAGTDPSQDRIDHAVALFRARASTREDKRDSVRSLADVLESRRQLIKKHLLSKDEDALFMIANAFDVRHHNANQRPDYADEYLDWLFWWYLATIELFGRLASR